MAPVFVRGSRAGPVPGSNRVQKMERKRQKNEVSQKQGLSLRKEPWSSGPEGQGIPATSQQGKSLVGAAAHSVIDYEYTLFRELTLPILTSLLWPTQMLCCC